VAARRVALTHDSVGEQLAAWGKVAMLQTIGRKSGKLIQTAVGFIEEDDGSMVVAAGSDSADWALNLRANAHAVAGVGDKSAVYNKAIELEGEERSAILVALILKYGTPAEGLGRGPVFRLIRSESAEG
jgi:deazaflavin-dependent oxidoreductase (nitroreductase family)